MRQCSGSLHLADNRIKRAIGVLRRTEIAQPYVRLDGDTLQECCSEPRFSDPGLAGQQHHLTLAVLCSGPAS
jgi:hypothetical protein